MHPELLALLDVELDVKYVVALAGNGDYGKVWGGRP